MESLRSEARGILELISKKTVELTQLASLSKTKQSTKKMRTQMETLGADIAYLQCKLLDMFQ